VTYSYGNLFDGGFNTLLTMDQIRGATEAALAVWASVVPINFLEVSDAGPTPSDVPYYAAGGPDIRLGYHAMADTAHAFFPTQASGLAGDVHFNNTFTWSYGFRPFEVDFVGAVVHELGHSLGIPHLFGVPAVMSGEIATAFSNPAAIHLYPADVAAAQRIYGVGMGSVTPTNGTAPVPEPATLVLLTAALAANAARGRVQRWRARRGGNSCGDHVQPRGATEWCL